MSINCKFIHTSFGYLKKNLTLSAGVLRRERTPHVRRGRGPLRGQGDNGCPADCFLPRLRPLSSRCLSLTVSLVSLTSYVVPKPHSLFRLFPLIFSFCISRVSLPSDSLARCSGSVCSLSICLLVVSLRIQSRSCWVSVSICWLARCLTYCSVHRPGSYLFSRTKLAQ